MPFKTKAGWKAWNEERHNFLKRETTGFTQDLQALSDHIIKLQEVCPKDSANFPIIKALDIITKLHRDCATFTEYLRASKPQDETHQD